jgi:hypothetical protein
MVRICASLASRALISAMVFAAPLSTAASGYWDTEIPTMQGATGVVREKDRAKASIRLSYELAIEDDKAPLKFYDEFLRSKGWMNQLSEVYEKFPEQFKRPPSEGWSSFAASSEKGSYQLFFASLWQNKSYGANATLRMRLTSLEGNAMKAHLDIVIAPEVDGSAFLKLVELTSNDPKALLRLAAIAGGDPFDIAKVDIRAVRSIAVKDELTQRYLEAIDSVMLQIANFSSKHLSSQ